MTDVQKKAAGAVLVVIILVVLYFLMKGLAPGSDDAAYSREMSQQIPAPQTGVNNPGPDPNAIIMKRGGAPQQGSGETGSGIGK